MTVRGASAVGDVAIVRCKLLVHPAQVQQRVDLPDQVIGRHHFVENWPCPPSRRPIIGRSRDPK